MLDSLYKLQRTPAFVLEETRLEENLAVIDGIQKEAPCSFLIALKGFAMFSQFPKISATACGAAVSSLNECRLAGEYFPGNVHAYAPVYRDDEFDAFAETCRHISFNSLSQYEHFKHRLRGASPGLRLNPEYSAVENDLYNPCIPGSRLGVSASELSEDPQLHGSRLPEGIEGFHVHNLCESGAEETIGTLHSIEKLYGRYFPQISWLNLGGGHLVTQKGYHWDILIRGLQEFHEKYPHISLILEPGAAFVWETGVLVSTILDIIRSGSYRIAMLDTSFAAHMPDCLEMPYTPRIRNGEIISSNSDVQKGSCGPYRLGGSSCLAGDFTGPYRFNEAPSPGDRIIFEDMMHYTMVKTTMFNGIGLPDIGIWRSNGTYEIIRSFGYEDYKQRLS
ncbi:MAG: carboxynorspermidine decarboxylase [Spirochaetia bacterium]|nr:carboxynorspermidine decarboxylase [Spirochaetia bacterium]